MKNELQTRGSGYAPGRHLWDEFDRFFESFLTSPLQSRGMAVPQAFTPPYDLEETENAYLMTFDVPGVNKDDLKIEINDNQLRISGERKREVRNESGEEGFRRYERAHGHFERVFTLPRNVDANAIEAHHDAGVLRLVLPKSEASRARPIQISSDAEKSGENFFSKWFGSSKSSTKPEDKKQIQ